MYVCVCSFSLHEIGYEVGARMQELLTFRDKNVTSKGNEKSNVILFLHIYIYRIGEKRNKIAQCVVLCVVYDVEGKRQQAISTTNHSHNLYTFKSMFGKAAELERSTASEHEYMIVE